LKILRVRTKIDERRENKKEKKRKGCWLQMRDPMTICVVLFWRRPRDEANTALEGSA